MKTKTWSQIFDAYIDSLGLSSAEVAKDLKVPPSSVSYWRRGATPRAKRCRQIQQWSKGDVPVPVKRRLPRAA